MIVFICIRRLITFIVSSDILHTGFIMTISFELS